MHEYGWEQPDFIFVTGDAYIDHPSFGPAIITRVLENFGYKCCIISQPDMATDKDFKRFGIPRLGFLVSSGNIDSMVNHYSVAKKRRKKDGKTPPFTPLLCPRALDAARSENACGMDEKNHGKS